MPSSHRQAGIYGVMFMFGKSVQFRGIRQ